MTSEQSPDEQNPGGPSPDDSTGGVTDADHAAPDDAAVTGTTDDAAEPDEAEPDEAEPKAAARSKIEAKRAAREADAAAAPSSGRQFTITARALIRAGIGLLLICALIVIGLLSWQYAEKSRALSAFDDAKGASTSFVRTYFETMMAPNATPDQIKSKVVPLTTGEARDRVEADAVSNSTWTKEAHIENATAEVNAAMVESFSTSKAVTVVAVTFSATSAAAPAGAKSVVLLQFDMVHKDGKWLVSKMVPMPGVSSQDAPGSVGGQTTSTTTPPAGDTTPPAGQTPAPQPAG
ncbi:hypothetical protein MYK68_12380 [Gordonia sp. PP30]|uniref:hypothetical protein n=1 Tax=Gordonia sp. PP30 TaxID=2935861 RepID=UPI001FFE522C|nr:hypothetical protein [Gordonia sp. PP30]UQE73548.1 hypothetical protein MYK68_12380 [Gordonia sp. PP30]